MPGTGEPAARSPRWPARSGGLAAPVAEVALVHARPNHLLAQVSRLGGGSAAGIPTAARTFPVERLSAVVLDHLAHEER